MSRNITELFPALIPAGNIAIPTTPTTGWTSCSTGLYQYSPKIAYRYFRLNIADSNDANCYLRLLALYDDTQLLPVSPGNMSAYNVPEPYVVTSCSNIYVAEGWSIYGAFSAAGLGWNQQGKIGWLQIDMGASNFILTKYRIYSTFHDSCPRDWQLLASNTGAFSGEQVTLDTQVDIGDWGGGAYTEYLIS